MLLPQLSLLYLPQLSQLFLLMVMLLLHPKLLSSMPLLCQSQVLMLPLLQLQL
jgi:hypothetical protein